MSRGQRVEQWLLHGPGVLDTAEQIATRRGLCKGDREIILQWVVMVNDLFPVLWLPSFKRDV